MLEYDVLRLSNLKQSCLRNQGILGVFRELALSVDSVQKGHYIIVAAVIDKIPARGGTKACHKKQGVIAAVEPLQIVSQLAESLLRPSGGRASTVESS